jgi:hypothetical protein
MHRLFALFGSCLMAACAQPALTEKRISNSENPPPKSEHGEQASKQSLAAKPSFNETQLEVVLATLKQSLKMTERDDWTIVLLGRASLDEWVKDQNYEAFAVPFLLEVAPRYPAFASAAGDLIRNNRQAIDFDLPPDRIEHITMISSEDYQAYLAQAETLRTDPIHLINDDYFWTAGLHVISRPGISRDGTVAVIYLSNRHPSARSYDGLRILVRVNDAWELRPEVYWPGRM